MKPVLIAGTSIVNLALIAYAIAIINEQRKRIVNTFIITLLTAGVAFDIFATTLMIIGSSHTAFTSHGLMGYSALLLMLTDCILLWKHFVREGNAIQIGKRLHLYSRIAFTWWVLAYITGAVIVMVRHWG